jgi:hypothetical protein
MLTMLRYHFVIYIMGIVEVYFVRLCQVDTLPSNLQTAPPPSTKLSFVAI